MSNTTSVSSMIVDPSTSNEIKYIIMQICYIPSIICSIFTLTHLLLNRNLRSTLHNHVPLISLIISILDAFLNHPFTLNYLRLSHVVYHQSMQCVFTRIMSTQCSLFRLLGQWHGVLQKDISLFFILNYSILIVDEYCDQAKTASSK